MGQICPHCQYESNIQSDFCPSCGAPMNEHVYAGRQKRARQAENNGVLLPLKWHTFVTWISLPLGILLVLITIIGTDLPAVLNFDASQYKPEFVEVMRFYFKLDLAAQLLLLPGFVAAEIGLLKKKWYGVNALVYVYLFQVAYALLNIYIFTQVNVTVFETAFSAVEMLLLFILTRIYYKKRRKIFS